MFRPIKCKEFSLSWAKVVMTKWWIPLVGTLDEDGTDRHRGETEAYWFGQPSFNHNQCGVGPEL